MASNKYELEKQKNEDFLMQLVAKSGKILAKAPIVPTKPVKAPAPRKESKKRVAKEEVWGRRTSSRLTVYAEDGTKLSREERQAELEAKIEREEREDFERRALKAKVKHDTRPVVTLKSVTGSGTSASLRKLFTTLANPPNSSSSSSSSSKRPNASTSTSTSTVFCEDTTKTREAFAKVAASYKLDALVKVVPNRIYSLAVHPSMECDVVFVGDKKGCIGIWDRTVYDKTVKTEVKSEVKDEEGDSEIKSEVKDEEMVVEEDDDEGKGKHWYYLAHGENSIACIGFRPNEPGAVYSAAYDCTLRKTNFLTFETEEVINGDAFGSDNLIHGFAFTPDGNEIWASDTNGGLMHRDLREPIETTRRWVVDQTGHKVGGISISSANPYLAVTAHLKKEMKVWDLKKLLAIPPTATVQKVQSCVLANYTYEKACTSAYFDSTGTRILSTSYDDKVRVWDLDPHNLKSITNDFEPSATISHDNQTGAYVSVFKAQWMPSPHLPPAFSIASMKRHLQIYTSTDSKLVASLIDGETTSVPAVTGSHPFKVGRVYGGTGAGKVVCYT